MAESTTVFVYNRDSVEAGDLLSKVASDDIGHEVVNCTLKVHVESAHFTEQRLQNGLHRPYMEILGSVSEMFIEDEEDRYFPCGTKHISMTSPQRVRISYIPSTAELKDLVNMGLYYKDFKVPKELVGGQIEIPSDITYTYVYESIAGIVEVNKPFEIETSTKENHYDGIFLGCDISEQRVREEAADYKYTMEQPVFGVTPYQSILQDYLEDDLDQQEVLAEAPDVTVDEDQSTMDKFAGILVSAGEEIGAKNAAVAASEQKRIRMVTEIEEEVNKETQVRKRTEAANRDVYAQLMQRNTADDTSAQGRTKMNYEAFKKAMERLQAKAAQSDEDAGGTLKEDLDKVSQVDRAKDNQALNSGSTDISGFGADTTANESEMTNEQKAKLQAKRSREAAHIVDRALDNQALNRGETDIAGQGAGNSSPQQTGAAMLRGLLGKKKQQPSAPNDGSPDYL